MKEERIDRDVIPYHGKQKRREKKKKDMTRKEEDEGEKDNVEEEIKMERHQRGVRQE